MTMKETHPSGTRLSKLGQGFPGCGSRADNERFLAARDLQRIFARSIQSVLATEEIARSIRESLVRVGRFLRHATRLECRDEL